MSDLLAGQEKQTVTINGRQIIKKHKTTVKQHISASAAGENPLSRLGYGIVAYVNILGTFAFMFLFFSLLMIPTIQGYKSGDAYDGDHFVGNANTMISNLGYSSVECRNIPISIGNIAFTCPMGSVGKILDYGVNNPEMGTPLDACITND